MHKAVVRRARRAAVVAAIMAAVAGAAAGEASAGEPGAVYTMTNSAPANFIRQFARAADGTITEGPLVATGGSGSTVNPPFGFPITDSVGALARTSGGRLLLAVNAGSNSVSALRVTGSHDALVLTDVEASRGTLPVSVAVTNTGVAHSLVYVLNAGLLGPPFGGGPAGTLSGYTLSAGGKLTPIPGAVYPVSDPIASQVGFDAHGKLLTVADRGTNRISTFAVDPSSGLLGPEQTFPATGTGLPFGFEYTHDNRLVFANAGSMLVNASVSSYDVSQQTGTPTPLDTESSGGGAACWVAITNDSKFAYISNTLTGTVARFRLEREGNLVLLGLTATLPFTPADLDTSANSKYLYVLGIDVTTGGFGPTRVDAYRIEKDGGLTLIDSSAPAPFNGASGLVAF